MTDQQRDELVAAACDVRQRAYAEYSKFLVGAAIRTTTGNIFVGCNVENASYGLTVCAERAAVFAAVAAGQRQFDAVAIATSGGHPPCGACRQVLAEFCEELPVLLVDVDQGNRVVEAKLSELLPGRFTL
jgi:cytidine deaminase